MSISFWFFKEIILTINYQEVNINSNFNLTNKLEMTLVNDSDYDVFFSWDGINLDGILKPKEVLGIEKIKINKIYVKGSGNMRIWAHELKSKE